MAEYFDVPFCGIKQPKQQLDRRRFAGAIWPEQAKHFTAPDFKIDIVHCSGFWPAPEILEDLG
jgi:hypothetical protein